MLLSGHLPHLRSYSEPIQRLDEGKGKATSDAEEDLKSEIPDETSNNYAKNRESESTREAWKEWIEEKLDADIAQAIALSLIDEQPASGTAGKSGQRLILPPSFQPIDQLT